MSLEVKEEKKESGMKPPYLIHELLDNLEHFHLGERRIRGKSDSFIPITFQDKRCNFQTPPLMVMFGLNTYTTPGTNGVQKFSLHFSLKPADQEMEEFIQFCYIMDDFAKEYDLNDCDKYWSAIRENTKDLKKHPVLRVKINCSGESKLLLDMEGIKGDVIRLPTVEEFQKYVSHRSIVRAILEVNPLWYSGKKYGLSYRLLKLQVIENPKALIEFRK